MLPSVNFDDLALLVLLLLWVLFSVPIKPAGRGTVYATNRRDTVAVTWRSSSLGVWVAFGTFGAFGDFW